MNKVDRGTSSNQDDEDSHIENDQSLRGNNTLYLKYKKKKNSELFIVIVRLEIHNPIQHQVGRVAGRKGNL